MKKLFALLILMIFSLQTADLYAMSGSASATSDHNAISGKTASSTNSDLDKNSLMKNLEKQSLNNNKVGSALNKQSSESNKMPDLNKIIAKKDAKKLSKKTSKKSGRKDCRRNIIKESKKKSAGKSNKSKQDLAS